MTIKLDPIRIVDDYALSLFVAVLSLVLLFVPSTKEWEIYLDGRLYGVAPASTPVISYRPRDYEWHRLSASYDGLSISSNFDVRFRLTSRTSMDIDFAEAHTMVRRRDRFWSEIARASEGARLYARNRPPLELVFEKHPTLLSIQER